MKIYYASVTNQVARFVKKLGDVEAELLDGSNADADQDFVLITPTYEPELLPDVFDFMADNHAHCVGIIGSGNRNFGVDYIYTAKDLSRQYDIPVRYDFEFNGTPEDIAHVKDILNELERH
jgi:protein involved in ribonucleotide reduction